MNCAEPRRWECKKRGSARNRGSSVVARRSDIEAPRLETVSMPTIEAYSDTFAVVEAAPA